ncbi:MAG: hypothetical protein GX146_08415, partial [Myxococcales bacterium]|nr:hypothetical protein [Myxococcales bacterium]
MQHYGNFMKVAWLAALLLAISCSKNDDDAGAEVSIGPRGGVVTGPDGASLDIPSGALDEEVRFSIHRHANTPSATAGVTPAGALYEFLPHGVVFKKDVVVTLPFDESRVADAAEALAVYWADQDEGPYAALPGAQVDGFAKRVSGFTRHLSYGLAGLPADDTPVDTDPTDGTDDTGDTDGTDTGDTDDDLPDVPTFTSLSAGGGHTCGIREDNGLAQCWGGNDDGQAAPPAGIQFTSLSTGQIHTCGIREDNGEALCWGSDASEQSAPPADVVFSSLSAGSEHTCGIREDNGQVQCWGNNDSGQSSPPEGVAFTGLSAGGNHTCGILADDGQALCWGDHAFDSGAQFAPPEGVAFASLSSGNLHTCGIRADNDEAECWGFNTLGSLAPPPEVKFSSISAGENHTCGIRADDG